MATKISNLSELYLKFPSLQKRIKSMFIFTICPRIFAPEKIGADFLTNFVFL
jgi:hypothetical protein